MRRSKWVSLTAHFSHYIILNSCTQPVNQSPCIKSISANISISWSLKSQPWCTLREPVLHIQPWWNLLKVCKMIDAVCSKPRGCWVPTCQIPCQLIRQPCIKSTFLQIDVAKIIKKANIFCVDGLCSFVVLHSCTFQQHFSPGPSVRWPSTRFSLGLPDVQSKIKKTHYN